MLDVAITLRHCQSTWVYPDRHQLSLNPHNPDWHLVCGGGATFATRDRADPLGCWAVQARGKTSCKRSGDGCVFNDPKPWDPMVLQLPAMERTIEPHPLTEHQILGFLPGDRSARLSSLKGGMKMAGPTWWITSRLRLDGE